MPILLAIARYLGVTGCVALSIIIFYEGLPIGPLRDVPYLGDGLSSLVDGRVDRERAAGAAAARQAAVEAQRARDVAKQQELDDIAKRYDVALGDQLAKHEKILALEAALKEMKEDDADAPKAAPARRCTVAFPRGVSRAINAVGR